MTNEDVAKVLIVEDETAVAEGYRLWLQAHFDVEVVDGGEAALDVLEDSYDVVLLDRMMPDMSGKQVLEAIREREIDCRVAMVTAVEPDFDIIEMGFDAYIEKPPEREDLIGTVEKLVERAEVDDELQEYYSLMAKRSTLEEQKEPEELEASEEYDTLTDQLEAHEDDVDDHLGDMSSDVDFVSAVREIADETDEDPPEEDS